MANVKPDFWQFIGVTFSFDIVFCCVINSYCSLFKYHLRIIIIVLSTTFVYIIALLAETILFSGLLIIGEIIWLGCHVTSVRKF